MAPTVGEDEVDDLIYFSRAGEQKELEELLRDLAARECCSTAEILTTVQDEGKSTCLHMATGNGHLEIIKFLVDEFASRPKAEKQAFLDAQNEFGNTGLHWAALGGHLDAVRVLMEHGASPAIANDRNYIPLDSANFNQHAAVAEYFLSFSSSLETGNESGLNGAVEAAQMDGVEDDAPEDDGNAGRS